MTVKKKSKATRRLATISKYVALKEYILGKIGEINDCPLCEPGHAKLHLKDIEDYINQLDSKDHLF